jgi:hypothetical protein
MNGLADEADLRLRFDVLTKTKQPELHRYWTSRDRAANVRLLPADGVLARLLGEQLEDGGWNCEVENGSVRSSFATTINALEGLLAHERATGGSVASIAARRRGEEYLLERKLVRRKSTGDVVNRAWLQFSFPTRWHYDVLRALARRPAALARRDGHSVRPFLDRPSPLIRMGDPLVG